MTKRFADFVMAIAVLNEGHDDPPINNGYASTPTPLPKPRFSVPFLASGSHFRRSPFSA